MVLKIPKYVMILGGLEGAGFDVDNIGEQVLGVVTGQVDASAIPGQVIAETVDVARNFKNDPMGTGMKTGMGIAIPFFIFKGMGSIAKGFGVPTTVAGVQWALPPVKHHRKKKSKRSKTRKVYVSKATGKRVKKPGRRSK